MAACDARVLVVVMSPPTTGVEDMLRPLAWEAEFAGRLHFVRAEPDDPRLRLIRGLEPAPEAAYLVLPDEFGMTGELSARLRPDTEPTEVLDAARAALQRHASQFEPRTVVEKFQRHGERGESDWYYLVQT